MSELSLVDCHTHAFPSSETGEQWQRAVGLVPKRSGHIDELAGILDKSGIARAVILLFHRSDQAYDALRAAGASAETAREQAREQLRSYNRWGCATAKRDPRFLAFVGINPHFLSPSEIGQEIRECARLGARGVKIMPSSTRLYPDDELFFPVYGSCVELGLPLLSQSGVGTGARPYEGADPYGRPGRFERVLDRFPDLSLVLAHLGDGFTEDMVELMRRSKRVWTDTSMRLSGLGKPGRTTPSELVVLIRRLGVDRVLFGSNFPITDPAAYVSIFAELPFGRDEREMIAAGNFVRLMDDAAS